MATIDEQVTQAMESRLGLIKNQAKEFDPVRRFDVGVDPGANIPGMPPNMGQFMLPHVATFIGLNTSAARVYRASDEALRNSTENARFMRNDPVVMECVEMRQRACALLDWHLEPENPKSPEQIDLVNKLTAIIDRIPRFMQYKENLLNATWFGRYGVFHKWAWKSIEGQMRLTIDKWKPVHGDKLVWRYDDGNGDYRADQIGIRIGAGYFGSKQLAMWKERYGDRIQSTDWGLAYFLDSWQQTLLSVHKHFIEDGEWDDPFSAGSIHGKGLRSRLYWTWFQKQESLAFMMEFLERSAAGFEIWSYPQGNPQAKEEVRKAATERSDIGRNVILVPRAMGEEGITDPVQRIEPGMAGVSEIKDLVERYFGHQIKRYILGQTLTTEAEATGLGSGVADVHLETFMQIIRYDAALLEETITEDLIEPLKRYNFPEAANIRVKFKIDTEQPDSQAKMEAFNMAYNMGLPIRGADVRDLIGAAKPEDDDEVLSFVDLQTQLAQANPQQPAGGPGMDGQPPQAGQSPADPSQAVDASVNESETNIRMSAAAHPVSGEHAGGVRPDPGDRSVLVAADAERAVRFARAFGRTNRYYNRRAMY